MITEITTLKGFKVLKLESIADALFLFNGGLSICDSCNVLTNGGYYIAVLNRFYCEKCFNEWHTRATYYKEDAEFENSRYEYHLRIAKKQNLIG